MSSRYQVQEQGTPFGRIFWAVFLASTAAWLFQTVVTIWMAKLGAQAVAAQVVAAPPPPVVLPAQPRATYQEVPLYLGPSTARSMGARYACVGGFVATRLPNGWDQSRRICRQSGD